MAEPYVSKPPLDSPNSDTDSARDKILGAAFLTGITGLSLLFGFGMTLAMAKRKDPSLFTKGLLSTKEVPESGSVLALKALGWGTLYSVSGFSLFCYGVWKILNVQELQEFRMKVGSLLPRIPKNEPQGRNDFKSLRELLTYVIEESEKSKKQ